MNKDHLGIVITALCLLAFAAASPMSGLFGNGYVVTPATDADIEGATPSDTVRVSFWDLPPRVMLLSVIVSVSPLLLFPIELLFFIKIMAILGYRKIRANNVLKSQARLLIYETIRANPGVYFNELSRQTRLNRGTLRYHLALMRMTGKVSTLTIGSDTRYFENSGKFTETEQKVLNFLRNDSERTIFEQLISNPATTRSDLERMLGISGAAVTWHMNRLRDAGILTATRAGKNVRYTIDPEAYRYLRKYLPVS
ncbi:MAG: Helix-turn-helix domain protein [Methanoregula sp. PtaU1.Bin051]|nr:MAG: Helix-turn-helix domain protein [Methanoregula sp. PtaU1.Bin051]